jgi:hypothetical protein
MPSKMKQVNARFEHSMYDRLKEAAKREKRSVSSQVVYIVERHYGELVPQGASGPGPMSAALQHKGGRRVADRKPSTSSRRPLEFMRAA